MSDRDDALSISNPRLIAAIYFGLLAVIANIIIDSVLYALGVELLFPYYQAVLLAAVIAAVFGALFGDKIIHSQKPYAKKVFWWGFLMALVALPFHTLFFLFFFQHTHPHLFGETSVVYYINMYALVLFYSFILFGIWLALLAGFAAVYLRGHLIYHMMNALYIKRKVPSNNDETAVGTQTPQHGQSTITMDEKSKPL
jgi:hypothetical protein